jgi:hypothetical protein
MKYKVGDKVRIRSGLIISDERLQPDYGGFTYEWGMSVLEDKELTISSVLNSFYEIAEDDDGYGWTDEMLEAIPNES